MGVANRRTESVLLLAIVCLLSFPLGLPAAADEPISDNSFLIEEAYNQEAGVVQHINAFIWNPDDEIWDYSFTQEWPVVSQLHQFSYTLPVSRTADPDQQTGVGDLILNYRYQAVMREGVALSPRLSFVLPTGEARDGLGSDTLGYQVNIPLSVELSEQLVMHWNLGATFLPDAEDRDGNEADNTGLNYGMSLVYLASPTFNFLIEAAGTSDELTVGNETTEREQSFVVSPGLRFAINFDSGLQIVPGVAVPIGIGPSDGEYGVIGYLSFEHPF